MLKRYMHKRERYFAMLGDNRVVRPFEWGTEFITGQANGDEPQKLFADFSEKILANSVEFFSRPEIKNYRLCGQSSPPYEGGVAEGRGGSPALISQCPDRISAALEEPPRQPERLPPSFVRRGS